MINEAEIGYFLAQSKQFPFTLYSTMTHNRRTRQGSKLEDRLMSQITSTAGIPLPARQYRFHPIRRWRSDFAWVDQKILVEVEGGTFIGGRHVTGAGYDKDCEKYNAATLMGWSVYRVTTKMISRRIAINLLKQVFGVNRSKNL